MEDVLLGLGSSPRVRGADAEDCQDREQRGIIPARAGSSSAGGRCYGFNWDHPRACGEQPLMPSSPHDSQGSSPRVRGAGGQLPQRRPAGGIIPARAGSSSGTRLRAR